MANRPDKHYELRSLPEAVLAQVDIHLARGEDAGSVADDLQKTGHFVGEKRDTVKRRLLRYRIDHIDVPTAAKVKSIARAQNPEHQQLLLRKADCFDAKAVMIELIQKQKERVFKWFTSGASSMPSTTVREDIKLLFQMCKDFANLQLEIGELRRVPKDVRALVGMIDEDNPNRVKFEADWNEQANVREAIEGMLAIMQMPEEEFEERQRKRLEHSPSVIDIRPDVVPVRPIRTERDNWKPYPAYSPKPRGG